MICWWWLSHACGLLVGQWEFQDPKMEVLYHIRQYFLGIFSYIGLVIGLIIGPILGLILMVGTSNQSVPEIPIDVGVPPQKKTAEPSTSKRKATISALPHRVLGKAWESHGPWGFNALWPSGNLHQLVRLWMVHLSKSGDPGGFAYLRVS